MSDRKQSSFLRAMVLLLATSLFVTTGCADAMSGNGNSGSSENSDQSKQRGQVSVPQGKADLSLQVDKQIDFGKQVTSTFENLD